MEKKNLTGYKELDHELGELQGGNVVVLGSRPGVGQTSLALNIALNGAKRGCKTIYYGLAEGLSKIDKRILSIEGKIPFRDICSGKELSEVHQKILKETEDKVSDFPLYVYSDIYKFPDIYGISQEFKRNPGLDLIIIDSVEFLKSEYDISSELKRLAVELDVPVICLAKIRKSSVETHRPVLTDIENERLGEIADIFLLLHREGYYDPATPRIGRAEIIIAKNKYGGLGTVELIWIPQFVLFQDIRGDRNE